MQVASENLIPVSLELGGKSPCFVDKTADLRLAAKKIVWGKYLNAGQTCISIDYVVVDNQVKDKFIHLLQDEIQKRYANAENSDNYPKIINQHHYDRLCNLIDTEQSVIGGKRNAEERKIAPTILQNADFHHEIMQDEIFGPLLPIIGYDGLASVIKIIKSRPKPLACYIFSENKRVIKQLNFEISYGGGCVNDVMLQIANHHMPFGGVGFSGIGNYHGKHSFDTFSHKKGVVQNTTKIDIGLRYAPYTTDKLVTLKIIRYLPFGVKKNFVRYCPGFSRNIIYTF